MKKKKHFIILLMVAFVSSMLVLSGCSENAETNIASSITEEKNSKSDKKAKKSLVQKVELIHFHGTYQCYACKTVGAYTEETLNNCFADELEEGKIIFKHINVYLPENKEIVFKYGATASSLWLGIYDQKGFHKEHVVKVWYKINNKMAFMSYLKMLIDKRLRGDFS
ncbi:MAG TPA: nitrophenyl compound nitroreductase subunit ArsF family protein [Nitrospinota bacterium]|nr:nitrophenyl compound nitroreductase subunit ArsF family protein [Nitrospinota bacterium]